MESGLLEAYECRVPTNLDVIQSLYKAGMPEGNIFDFTSSRILKFEHKWNTEQKKKAIVGRYKTMGNENTAKAREGSMPPTERSMVKSERSVSAKSSKTNKKDDGKATKDQAKSKDTKTAEKASVSQPAKKKK